MNKKQDKNTFESPWRGLYSYEEKNAELFFGRARDTENLTQKIIGNTTTIVYGPSGCGKSSLLKAGVFPALRKHKFFPVELRLDHERDSKCYFEQVKEKIEAALDEYIKQGRYGVLEEFAPLPEGAEETLWTWLHRHRIKDELDEPMIPVLVLDQFEEFFTISKKENLAEEVQNLCDVAGNFMPQKLEELINKRMEELKTEFAALEAQGKKTQDLREEYEKKRKEYESLKDLLAETEKLYRKSEELAIQDADAEKLRQEYRDLSIKCEETGKICSELEPQCIEAEELRKEFEEELNKKSIQFPTAPEYRLVLSLRGDFIYNIDKISGKCDALRKNRINVPLFNKEQALEVITRPGKDLVEEDAVEEIISAVSRMKDVDDKSEAGNILWKIWGNIHVPFLSIFNKGNAKKDGSADLSDSNITNEGLIEPTLLSLLCEQLDLLRQKNGKDKITKEQVEEQQGNILNNFYENTVQEISKRGCRALEKNILTPNGFRLLKERKELCSQGIKDNEIEKLVKKHLLRLEKKKDVEYVELCHDVMIPVIKQQNYLRLKRMRNRVICAEIAAALLFCIIAQGIYYLFWADTDKYYKNFGKRFGVMFGIEEIDPEIAQKRLYSCKFTTEGFYDLHWIGWKRNNFTWKNFITNGKYKELDTYVPLTPAPPKRVTIVNSKLEPMDNSRYFFGTYLWNLNDTATLNSGISDNEKEAYSKRMKTVCIVDVLYEYKEDKKDKTYKFFPICETGKNNNGNEIWSCVYLPMPKDFEESEMPEKNIIEKTEDKKIKPKKYKHDRLITFISAGGFAESQLNKATHVGIQYDSATGFEVMQYYFDQTGCYATGSDDAHARYMEYDDMGRTTLMVSKKANTDGELENFDDNAGNCMLKAEYEKDKIVYTYLDTNKKEIEPFIINSSDAQESSPKRHNYTRKTITLDDAGNFETCVYMDKNGNTVLKEEYVIKNGNTVLGEERSKRPKEIRYLESVKRTSDIGIDNNDGIKCEQWIFNPQGEVSSIEYYADKDGKIKAKNSNNLYKCEYTYQDKDKKMLKEVILTGEDIWDIKGIKRVKRTYNTLGKITEEARYTDQKDKAPVQWENYTYGDDNKTLKEEIFVKKDIEENPGVYRIKRIYNPQGNLKEKRYFADKEGTIKAKDSNNIYWQEHTYTSDEKTRTATINYGKDIWGYKGVNCTKTTYDKHGNIKQQELFTDKEMQKRAFQEGMYKAKLTYSKDGKILTKIIYLGENIWKNSDIKRIEQTYNLQGHITDEALFEDEEGNIMTQIRKYVNFYAKAKDDDGETRIKTIYLWENVWGNKGVGRVEQEFNSQGSVTETRFFKDEAGKIPAKNTNNQHKCIYTYENDGTTRKEGIYLGENIWGIEGARRAKQTFNPQGSIIEQEIFADEDGQKTVYDQNNINKVRIIYAADGKTKINFYSFGENVYGHSGVKLLVELYDESGQKVLQKTHYADEAGEIKMKVILIGEKAREKAQNKDVVRIEQEFNGKNQKEVTQYYADEKEPKLALDKNNVHTYHYEYAPDEVTMTKRIMIGRDLDGHKGVCRMERTLDPQGEVVETRYFADEKGEKPIEVPAKK